jgi:hypothetical protein
MSLILEIAAGILLGFGLLKLPAIYRRWKVKKFYLSLEPAEVFNHVKQANLYTDAQQSLLMSLATAQSAKARKKIASQLAQSFAEK